MRNKQRTQQQQYMLWMAQREADDRQQRQQLREQRQQAREAEEARMAHLIEQARHIAKREDEQAELTIQQQCDARVLTEQEEWSLREQRRKQA